MSETFPHQHNEIVSRERAAALAQAAGEAGATVTALANEGDPYVSHAGHERVVPEGHMHVSVSGNFDRVEGTQPMLQRAGELETQARQAVETAHAQQEQHPAA